MVKLLLAGHVGPGALQELAAKVRKLNTAHGPFDILFVTDIADEAGLRALAEGDSDFPISLAFTSAAPVPAAAAMFTSPLRGVTFLGEHGIADVAGLRVAFSNNEDATADAALINTVRASSATTGERPVVDLLISPHWPAGVVHGSAEAALSPAQRAAAASGRTSASTLARATEPRYHVVGGPATPYFARAPYGNPATGVPTRFVSLGPVPSATDASDESSRGERKHLHALNLVPAASSDARALAAAPPGTTPNPYVAAAAAAAALAATAAASRPDADGAPSSKRPRHDDESGAVPPLLSQLAPGAPAPFNADRAAAIESEAASSGQQFFWRLGRGGARNRGGGGDGRRFATGANAEGWADAGGGGGALAASILAAKEAEAARTGKDLEGNRVVGGPGGGRGRRGTASGPPAECWFCLASPHVEKHLVIAIGDESYVGTDTRAYPDYRIARELAAACTLPRRPLIMSPHVHTAALPKGGIVDDHLLVVPIEHTESMATASPALRAEAARFVDAIARMFAAQGRGVAVFERVLHAPVRGGAQSAVAQRPAHTHFQVVPLPASVASRARDIAITEGSYRYVPLTPLAPDADLALAVAPEAAPEGSSTTATTCEYFYLEVPEPELPAVAPAREGVAADAASSSLTEAATIAPAAGDEHVAHSAAMTASVATTRPPFVRLLHRVPRDTRHPVQFGRELLCRVLEMPDRLSWKACVTGTEKETQTADAVRSAFAAYDFTAEL